jgi:hypothetical protein
MPDQSPVNVTVTWNRDAATGEDVVIVSPPVVQVRPGQRIRFIRAGTVPGRMRLTFKDRTFFGTANPEFEATGAVHEGDGDVSVKEIPYRTTYECELFDPGGQRIAGSRVDAGGAVEPEKN